MLRFFAPILLAAAGITVSACSNEEYSCDDTGCFYCDGLGCRRVQPDSRTACFGDVECASSERCTDAGCVPICAEDRDCPDGTVCRGDLCLEPTEPDPIATPGSCERSDECPEGALCLNGLCAASNQSCGQGPCSCADSEVCAAGFVCSEQECRPESDACQFDVECGQDASGGGRFCIDGACHDGCGGAGQTCLAGQTCIESVCRDEDAAVGQCQLDVDCQQNLVCLDSSCVEGCSADSDCSSGYYCLNRQCRVDDRPQPFCSSDAMCVAGRRCVDGVCRTPCATSQECLRFDVQFVLCSDEGFCLTSNEAGSDCATSVDCTADRECRDGICL